MKKNIPNILTILRIILTILSSILLLNNYYTIAIIFLIFGALTDFLDGYFARKFKAASILGAKLDQLSDKLYTFLICITLIILGNNYLIITVVIELVFSLIVSYKTFKNDHWQESTRYGKIKTTYIFITILIALFFIKFDVMLFPFVFIWGLTLIFQLYYNYKIVKEFGKYDSIKTYIGKSK